MTSNLYMNKSFDLYYKGPLVGLASVNNIGCIASNTGGLLLGYISVYI